MQGWTKKVVSKDDWEKKLAAVKVYKEDMNKLVMDFLVTEVGYRSKAEVTAHPDTVMIDLGIQSMLRRKLQIVSFMSSNGCRAMWTRLIYSKKNQTPSLVLILPPSPIEWRYAKQFRVVTYSKQLSE